MSVMLAGCASPPRQGPAEAAPAPPPATPGRDDTATLTAFENQQRARARQAQQAGQPLAAQQAWAAVLALKPADAEAQAAYAQAGSAARSAAAERLRRADQARSRGEGEAAMRLYLEALAQDPTLPGPPEALRALERERAARAGAGSPGFARPYTPGRYTAEFEHAELLAEAGELDAAVALLEPLAREAGANADVKRKACDLLLRRAEAPGTPRDGALAFIERCLRLLPRHAPALQLRATLRAPQR